MRLILFCVVAAGTALSQTMTEAAAAAAGSAIGSVAGKQISAKIDQANGKTASVLEKAAKTGAQTKAEPLLKVGPGVPKTASVSKPKVAEVPAPPPVRPQRAAARPAPKPAPIPVPVVEPVMYLPPPPPPPPPPVVTPADLARVSEGMARQEVLAMGAPSGRMTMYEDGHLVEVYRYQTRDTTFGVVRLIDGAVSRIEVR